MSQQADPVLSKFLVAQVEETVFLRWTITAGNTCEDTHIERSADGIAYERIGLIGGICGSPDQAITYEFTDTMPLINRKSYYRLELGFYGYSSPQSVEIFILDDNNYLLAPNPFTTYTQLRFENGSGEEYQLRITDMQGRIVMESATRDDFFIIKRGDLSQGVFIFRVTNSGKALFRGKLMAL